MFTSKFMAKEKKQNGRYEFRTREELLFEMGKSPLVFFQSPTDPASVEACIFRNGNTYIGVASNVKMTNGKCDDIFVRLPFAEGGMTHELEYWKAPKLIDMVEHLRSQYPLIHISDLGSPFWTYWV